jgi:hypothetical protein
MGRWAEVITLGQARFAVLHSGPFDGRCYPMPDGTPDVLDVPAAAGVARYVLRDGRYRYAGATVRARSAA